MFEKEKSHMAPEVGRMLDRLEKKLEKGKLSKDKAGESISLVDESILYAKEILDSSFDFKNASKEDIAKLTNAWKAWEKDGVFKDDEYSDLQKKLESNFVENDRMQRFMRQIWRTEMSSYLIKKLENSDRSDSPAVVEAIMSAQIVSEKENDAAEALYGAQELDPKLAKKSFRDSLAKEMEASEIEGNFYKLKEDLDEYVSEVKVVTGGEFLSIPEKLAKDFEFKHVVRKDDRLYAQMKNGCRGNLVIIELGDLIDDKVPAKDDTGFLTTENGTGPEPLEIEDSPKQVKEFRYTIEDTYPELPETPEDPYYGYKVTAEVIPPQILGSREPAQELIPELDQVSFEEEEKVEPGEVLSEGVSLPEEEEETFGIPELDQVSFEDEAEPLPLILETEAAKPVETAMGLAEGKKIEIPGVTEERIEKAERALEDAYAKIKNEIAPAIKSKAEKDGASYEIKTGNTVVQEIVSKGFDKNDYLPLMIKESRLDTDVKDGYFQITKPAAADVAQLFEVSTDNLNDPKENSVIGILYLNLVKNKYAKNKVYGEVSEDDREMLAHAIFNKGPGTVSKLWELSGAKNYKEFEDKVSAEIVKQLGDTVTGGEFKHDVSYNVPYFEPAGVTAYLKLESGDAKLKKEFTIDGKKTGIKVDQAAIMIRYSELIKGIESVITSGTFETPTLAEVTVETKNIIFTDHIVKKGDTLWRLGQDYGVSPEYLKRINSLSSDTLSEGKVLQVPNLISYEDYYYDGFDKPWITATRNGFYSSIVKNEKYSEYLKSEIELDTEGIKEVVIDFNRRYNPELKDLNEETSNIPEGAKIWVPNVRYFMDFYAGKFHLKPTPVPHAPAAKAAPKPTSKPDSLAEKLPPVPEFLGEIPQALDKTTHGQYVKKVAGVWVRDVEMMRKGAERFVTKSWDRHPTWDETYLKDRTLFNGNAKLEEVRFIVLHSTSSDNSSRVTKDHNAHFVVERDGTIRYVVPVKKEKEAKYKVPPHAGQSAWQGVSDLNQHSIGIEVVAKDGQEWSEDQYKKIKELCEFLGGYHGLQKRDVVLHKQIAYSKWGRGRKSDPYDNSTVLFQKLGLPDNSKILDMEVANGNVDPNIKLIREKKYGHRFGPWDGMEAANSIKGKEIASSTPKMDKEAVAKWKKEVAATSTIKSYEVQKGDSLYKIAKANNTSIEAIKAYNQLTSDSLKIGQKLEIPIPKD